MSLHNQESLNILSGRFSLFWFHIIWGTGYFEHTLESLKSNSFMVTSLHLYSKSCFAFKICSRAHVWKCSCIISWMITHEGVRWQRVVGWQGWLFHTEWPSLIRHVHHAGRASLSWFHDSPGTQQWNKTCADQTAVLSCIISWCLRYLSPIEQLCLWDLLLQWT